MHVLDLLASRSKRHYSCLNICANIYDCESDFVSSYTLKYFTSGFQSDSPSWWCSCKVSVQLEKASANHWAGWRCQLYWSCRHKRLNLKSVCMRIESTLFGERTNNRLGLCPQCFASRHVDYPCLSRCWTTRLVLVTWRGTFYLLKVSKDGG